MDIFFIEDDDLLEKCNIIWDKISANIKKEFDSKLVYKKKKIKTKTHVTVMTLQIFMAKKLLRWILILLVNH